MNNVQEIGGDGVEEPRDDDAVHASPRRIIRTGGVAEDVVLQSEAAEDEQNVATPLGIVGGVEVQNNGDEVLDVLDSGSLAVEMSDGSSFRGEGAGVVLFMVVVITAGLGAKPFPEVRGQPLEEVRLGALLFQGVGGSADTVLGRGGGLEEVRLLSKLVHAGHDGLVLESVGGCVGVVAQLGRGGGGRRAG